MSVLTAQAHSLIKAWRYTPSDLLLHVLPLHHIHGTVNALITPLFAGSTVKFLFSFNADGVCIGGRDHRVRGEDGGEKERRTGPGGDLVRYL
jgi:acyl-CoA synthetase (AMP-forming)/AMP-acid ligase II